MTTRELGLERARRQKWLTGLVMGGLSVMALAVALTYWGSTTHRTSQVHNLPSPAPDVHQQLSGHTITRSDGDRPVFTIHAARTVSYQQSKSTVLEDVTVEIFGRKGDRSDILRTHRCEYDPQSGDFLSSGPVQIELSAHSSDIPGSGLRGKHRVFLETSKVAYHQGNELAETDEPVKFRMGPASGTALGLVYATRDGWFKLKHDVAVDLPQGTEKAPQPPIHMTASALRYDKGDGQVALAGPVEVTEGERRVVSESAHVTLGDHNRVSRVNLEGRAKAFDVNSLRSVELNAERVQGDFDAASGQLRHLTAENDVVGESKGKGTISRLTAERVEMDLGGKHPQPLQGVATGNVHINWESQPVLNLPETTPAGKSPEKKTLTAAEVRFDFRPDTHSLKNAETVGPGTLLISPGDPKAGERVITAGQFLMTFDARSRIESLRGTAPTQVLFRPPATAPAGSTTQQSQADRLDAVFDVGTQTLREVVQTGDFQYRDGDRQASADDAYYDAQTQTLLLLGHPQVWDTNSRVKCQKITIDMPTDTSTGEGKVQATHLPSPAPGAPSAATPVLPTNVLADRMVARRQSQTVHYEGHVRAWQGTDVVESSSLDVYRAQKRVSSGSQVVTSYLQPAAMVREQGVAPPSTGETRPVTVHADFLEYFDQGRRARYHGNVRLVTESTTLQSDRLDVYFTQGDTVEGSEVDHAESDGHVKVTQPGRVGTGDHAEYYAGPGKIVLTGGPPSLVDEKKGSTTGQRLTFFIHDDRLFVDGGDQSPSLSTHRVAP
ncbi:MAG TPA: LptA/OstA family protein [Terriglobia bacterium]|nr:LptA/OstA family protein [Terriglobia bacterium]